MATPTVKFTRDYSKFTLSSENREINLAKHAKLKSSMEKHGFLSAFPILVKKSGDQFEIIDGQHRFTIARKLSLPFYFTETSDEFDVAEVNLTSVKWNCDDYAYRYAKTDDNYRIAIDFSKKYGIPLSRCAGLLHGHVDGGNVLTAFKRGVFVIKDPVYAERVATIYSQVISISKESKNIRFLDAVAAVCRVDCFDEGRFLRNAIRCRDLLGSRSTRDAYLEMIEKVYNYGSRTPVYIKIMAIEIMKSRGSIRPIQYSAMSQT